MDRAQFGRMELGRCVTRNFGHVGCTADVINQLDYACSGRQSCDISVSDQSLVRTKPCPKDFTSYLDASYKCVSGMYAEGNLGMERPRLNIWGGCWNRVQGRERGYKTSRTQWLYLGRPLIDCRVQLETLCSHACAQSWHLANAT